MAVEPAPRKSMPCRICGGATEPVGRKFGRYAKRWYQLARCPACGYSFIEDPWTDFSAVYSAAYYQGSGADPLVDYVFELEHPQATIRRYEWEGIVGIIRALLPQRAGLTWLDFGCGNGGLVRYVNQLGLGPAVGFEEGWIKERAQEHGIPILDRSGLEAAAGTFDIVTAIEVLEHVADPLEVLRTIRRAMKPGALFFYTTGNAAPFRGRMLEWGYVVPEVHISFFEPRTMAQALERTGFRPDFRGFLGGFARVIEFRTLKQLHARRASPLHGLLPWPLLSRLIDARRKVSGHPVGWSV